MTTLSLITMAVLANSSQNSGFDAARLAQIPVRLKESIKNREIAGTVVLVQRHGKTVLLDAQGMAHEELKRPMVPDSIFQIYSMTKPITAIAVMICVERGLVNLDDPADRYIPNLAKLQVKGPNGVVVKAKGRPTVRQLITHTAGFGSNDPGGLDDEAKRKLTLQEYAERLHEEPLIAEPGTEINYSGPAFAAAGRIVEVVTGKTLDAFMESEIFAPLGMKDTSMFLPVEKRGRAAYPYMVENNQLKLFFESPLRIGAKYANPAGGLYSTASDMATLMTCMIEGGKKGRFRLLSPASVTTMSMLQTGTLIPDKSDIQGYGLGFAVVRSAGGTAQLKPVGSYGHVGALETDFWGDPKTGVVAVFMSQSWSSRVRKTFNTMVNAAFVGP